MEIDVVRTSYYMLVADTNKSGDTYIVPRSEAAIGVWELMETSFKFLISQAFFTDFAKMGSAVFSGDWMISQYGTPALTITYSEKIVLRGIVETKNVSLMTLAALKTSDGTYKTTDRTYTALRSICTDAQLQKAIDQAEWAVGNGVTYEQLQAMSTTSYQLFGADPDDPFKLFAPNIALDFLTGKAYLQNADVRGNIIALSGTFRGKVYAEDGNFSGEIESTKGRIGGFNITEENLTAIDGALVITPNGIEFRPANGSVAWLGALDNIIGAFYAKAAAGYKFACGAQFGAEGASILNAAIDITKGTVSGLLLVMTEFTTDITIACDNNVANDTTAVRHVRSGGVFIPLGNSNLTVTLPAEPANGTMYTFIETRDYSTTLKAQGADKICVNSNYAYASASYILAYKARLTVFYNKGYWYGNF